MNKESKKEEQVLLEKRELNNYISDLALQLERQDAQIREMNRTLAEVGMCTMGTIHICLSSQ